jgi:hypothetical protein
MKKSNIINSRKLQNNLIFFKIGTYNQFDYHFLIFAFLQDYKEKKVTLIHNIWLHLKYFY